MTDPDPISDEALAELAQLCQAENWRHATWNIDAGLRVPGAETAAAGQDPLARIVEIPAAFEIAVSDQKLRVAFRHGHPTPHFRHEQTDVMVNPAVWTNVGGRRDKDRIAGQQHRDEGVVQINDRRQGIERSLGQCAFRTRSRGGRGFSGHAADVLNEKFRQIHVVDGIIDCQRADACIGVGRVVASAGNHRVHH